VATTRHTATLTTDCKQGWETMKSAATLALLLVLATCGESPGGRAVTGGLLGAGTGAAVSGITGGSLGTGALVGGGIGAAGGALTAPRRRSYDESY